MSRKSFGVWLGFDPRQASAFAVARNSIRKFNKHLNVNGVVLSDLYRRKLYWRRTEHRLGKLWDCISEAHMSTEFAISRFLVPELVRLENRIEGWAVFMDCDVLVRTNLHEMTELFDDDKALMCVKHDHKPEQDVKMDGQRQTAYPRKNWSSVMAFNVRHPSNARLNAEMVNTLPGRDLHRFCWLKDDEIGELPAEWNYLVGHTEGVNNPKIVHFTDGGPWFPQFVDVPYGQEWRAELERWAN